MSSKEKINHVADTAYWMASYRATESKRPDALFRDPLAEVLIGDRGPRIANSMASTSKYSYWSLITRTKIIDDLITKSIEEGAKTIINLGAGLDARPYRMDLPSDVRWIEIDFPDVIELKTDLLKSERPKCQLERIALDLSDQQARHKVFTDLNERVSTAIVLTEGVIPYLTEDMVLELGRDLSAMSNIKYWIGEFYARELYARFQSPGFAKLLGDAPFRFFPTDWFEVFRRSGWHQKEMRYLYDEGERVKRHFPLPWFIRALKHFVPEKVAEKVRLQAYVVFAKPNE